MKSGAVASTWVMGRLQFICAVFVLVFLSLVCVALSLLMRWQVLDRAIVRIQEGQDRARKQRYSYEHFFIDFEDRLINEELPSVDYTRGGVYLMGTSNLKWASRFWELPEKRRALIHNFGIGASSHEFQFHFLKFLIEEQGMLSAGGEKSCVIFGVSRHAVGPPYSPTEYFPSLWERHGYYKYDERFGIIPQRFVPLARWLHFERVRIYGFVRCLASIGARWLGYKSQIRRLTPDLYMNEWGGGWSPSKWLERMRQQVAIFGSMIVDLRARGVKVMVVLLPQGSWELGLQQRAWYDKAVQTLCAKEGIPLLDWSHLLDDDDFADSNHPNPDGVDKLNSKFLELALPFLHSTGALKPGD